MFIDDNAQISAPTKSGHQNQGQIRLLQQPQPQAEVKVRCVRGATIPNVRYGSKADIGQCARDVRFTPKSGHSVSGICSNSHPRAPWLVKASTLEPPIIIKWPKSTGCLFQVCGAGTPIRGKAPGGSERLITEEGKKQENMESITAQAALQLGEDAKPEALNSFRYVDRSYCPCQNGRSPRQCRSAAYRTSVRHCFR